MLASSLTLVAGSALADEAPTRPEPHESDARPPGSVRLYTALGGLGFTTAMWGLNYGLSYAYESNPGMTDLRVPVAGPWMALANNHCVDGCGFGFYFSQVYYVIAGLAQAGGLGVALESVLVPTASKNDPPRPTIKPPPLEREPDGAPPPSPSPSPSPTPTPGPSNQPLFYVPMPIHIGQAGVGVGWGGLF